MRHAHLNRPEAAAERAHNGSGELQRGKGITFKSATVGFNNFWTFLLFFVFFPGPLSKPSSRTSFEIHRTLPAVIWTRWPARDCSSSVSSCHCSVSLPLSPLLSWLNGRGSPRERRTASTRACGWPAAATREPPVNFTSPSWSCQVSFCISTKQRALLVEIISSYN